MKRRHSLWLRASALAIAAACATSAQAQDQDPSTEVEGLVVTGSQIRGVAAAGSPTAAIDLEEVKASGVASASEAVRLLPQILNFGADETRNSFTGGAQDAAANATAVRSVNLRGIGPEATLLLVNGRRMPPSGVIKAISDLDFVPVNALARVEVVSDGASAIYGADAVAGVVNLITRRPSDGIELMARYGGADGMEQIVFGGTFSKTWEGGGVFLAAENNYRSNLSGRDRDFASQDRRLRGGSDQRSFLASPGNITLNPTTGAACTVPPPSNPTGTTSPAVIGSATCRRYQLPAGNGVGINPAQIVSGNANRFDEAAFSDLLPEQDRDSVLINARQQLTRTIDVWYEGIYSYRWFDQAQPPALGNLTVPSTNPWYVRPAGLPATASVNVEFRLTDDFNPNSDGTERTYLNAVGLGWDITEGWRMESYANFGVDDGLQRRQSVLNNRVLATALASSNPTTAFNPFGDGTFNRTNNPALLDLIDAERLQYATARTNDFVVKFDGPLMNTGGGEVKLAVGAEYHDNSFKQALYATNVSSDGSVTTKFVDNGREIASGFVELFAPLVSDANAMSGVQQLDLSLAVRFDDYSDFGNTTNPKVGIIWSPAGDLSFRATYGTSFRAPSLVDSADQILNIFIQNLTSPTGTMRGLFFNGGNSGLQPEEATTYTAGLDWQPERFDGLRASLTYYNIDYTNRIDVVPNTALTNPAYAAFTQVRTGPGDAAFNTRAAALLASPDLQNPVEPVANLNAIIDGRRQNLGSMVQDGIDLSLQYSFESPYGDWTLGLDASKILTLERVTVRGTPVVDVLDKFGNPVDFRARGSVAWRNGPWAAFAFVNFVDGYTNTAVTPNTQVGAWTTLDASVSYDFGEDGPLKGTKVLLTATNLFDQDPPVVLNGTVSWDSQAASPVGRFIALELSKRY